jgi:hypothetical protein
MNSMTEEGGHDDDAADYARRYVDHTYQDFSRYLQQGGEIPKHKKSGSNFPARLHHMLEDPNNSHIIAWMVTFCYLAKMLYPSMYLNMY